MATFGNTGIGSSDYWANVLCTEASPASNGTLDSISLHAGAGGYYAPSVKFALYDSDGADGGPGTRLAITVAGSQAENTWLTLAVDGAKPELIAGHSYWLAFGASGSYFGDGYSGGGNTVYLSALLVYPPSPAGSFTPYGSEKPAIYGTYTLSGNRRRRVLIATGA